MAIGLGLLRLSPDAFWSMTPTEFERAMRTRSSGRAVAPQRRDLVALMTAFPDIAEKEA